MLKWGILGVAIAALSSVCVSGFGSSVAAIKMTGCGFKNFAQLLLLPLLGSTGTIMLILWLKSVIGVGIFEFITLSCAGVSFYIAIVYLFDKLFGSRIHSIFTEIVQLLRSAHVRNPLGVNPLSD